MTTDDIIKTVLTITRSQLGWLDQLALHVRARSGFCMNRGGLLRSIISLIMDSGLDFSEVEDYEDFEEILSTALLSGLTGNKDPENDDASSCKTQIKGDNLSRKDTQITCNVDAIHRKVITNLAIRLGQEKEEVITISEALRYILDRYMVGAYDDQ